MSTRDVVAVIGEVRERAHHFIQGELEARGLAGLAPSHGAILSALFRVREIRMSELADRIRRDKSTVTILVRKLEKHGYVRKRKDSRDGRVVYVDLTDAGRATEPAFREISDLLLAKVYRGFKSEEKRDLTALLGKILSNWQET